MCCSASGSMESRYQAWLPAPPRCFWSTGAREPDEVAPQNKGLRAFTGGLCARRGKRSALRLLGLLFLFGDFLDGLFGGFLRRGFLGSLLGFFGFFGFLRRRLFRGFLGGLLFLFDRRLGGYFRRRRGARHWACRRCRNGLLVVHIGPPWFVEAVTIAGFADV